MTFATELQVSEEETAQTSRVRGKVSFVFRGSESSFQQEQKRVTSEAFVWNARFHLSPSKQEQVERPSW